MKFFNHCLISAAFLLATACSNSEKDLLSNLSNEAPAEEHTESYQAFILSDGELSKLKQLALAGRADAAKTIYLHYGALEDAESDVLEWAGIAAALGDPDMQWMFGKMLLSSAHSPEARVDGLNWYVKAIKNGKTSIIAELVSIYRDGEYGVRRNQQIADCWSAIDAQGSLDQETAKKRETFERCPIEP